MQNEMLCLVVGVSLLLSRLAGAQGYQWTEIVIPGTTVLQAWQINDSGQVALFTTDAGNGIYADGTFTPLPAPPEGIQSVAPLGINNDGVITGGAVTVAGDNRGFILRGSTYTIFSRPGWANTFPRSISNSGLITGTTDDGAGRTAGFIYDPDTDTFTDATPPGSFNHIVQGMNAFGRITGHGNESPGIGRYGFVWQQGTISQGERELRPFLARLKIADLGTATRGINDSGIVVGFTNEATGENQGFVGNDASGYERLIAPGGEIAGNSTICSGINNLAQVVCYVWDSTATPLGAFIGSPATGEGSAGASKRPASTGAVVQGTNKTSVARALPNNLPDARAKTFQAQVRVVAALASCDDGPRSLLRPNGAAHSLEISQGEGSLQPLSISTEKCMDSTTHQWQRGRERSCEG